MSDDVWVVGAAMTKFGRYDGVDAFQLGAQAARAALADGGVSIADVGVLAAGCMTESNNAGQMLLRHVGQTGIACYNVVNGCATGGTAVRTAVMAVKAGECDVAMAVGMEKMGKAGLLGVSQRPGPKRFEPAGRYGAVMNLEGVIGTNIMPAWFALIGGEYADRYEGVGFEQFARVAEKNHSHSTLNPLAQYQKPFTLGEIMDAEMIAYPNTVLMCSPTGDGAAAVVVVSGSKLRTLGLDQQARAVKVSASVITSDPYTDGGDMQHDTFTTTRNAADQAYEAAGVGPQDLDLVELHDCFATAELCHYDALRLCEPGGAGDFIDSGAPWRDGRLPVNVSGGLLSKGHPIAATGVANVFEVTTHLRNEAGARQIDGARVGLTHVLGGGVNGGWTTVVHVLEKAAV
jgi:acetyl-CoA acetyltransferase